MFSNIFLPAIKIKQIWYFYSYLWISIVPEERSLINWYQNSQQGGLKVIEPKNSSIFHDLKFKNTSYINCPIFSINALLTPSFSSLSPPERFSHFSSSLPLFLSPFCPPHIHTYYRSRADKLDNLIILHNKFVLVMITPAGLYESEEKALCVTVILAYSFNMFI